ncbi:MAG: DUF58 domain-containing protein [Porphyromonas sp.]|jgi:hypothetical protein|nr:MAG: DUF58 domain-containing protein [Porphyromonas sp.]
MAKHDQALDLLSRVRSIEVKAKGLSEQVFAGQYHSAFRGRGMAFSEVRNYQVGDDVRDLDWNVTARYASPFVKVFEEERELTMMLLIDLTESTLFGGQHESVKELMAEISATIAFSAMQNNDKIGAIFFSNQIELFIPPRSGKKHILHIIRELLAFKPKGKSTDINVPLSYLSKTIKKRCTAFLISDFIQTADNPYTQTLSLAGRKHDVIALRIYEPQVAELPKWGLTLMEDLENKTYTWVDTSDKKVRATYKQNYLEQVEQCKKSCSMSATDLIEISTGEDFTIALRKLFRHRS